jgi:uncharacterized protein (TIGR03118 family)
MVLKKTIAPTIAMLSVAFASSLGAANGYLVHNLVSDLPGLADHLDPNLVNPWGIAFSATSPFWIGDNHSGKSTLYDGTGTPVALIVGVPAPAGPSTAGAITGVVFNGTTGFLIPTATGAGAKASFMFCTEDGTIAAWNAGTAATILVNNATKAVYKGCTLGGATSTSLLYAANFQTGKVDVFDQTFKPATTAGGFTNAKIPAGFAPFDIVLLGGKLYVTYAKQDSALMDDVAGPGNGYVAVFDLNGNLLTNLISQGSLNSPWGVAIAPATFGTYAAALLVGNFGDGTINAFDPSAGTFLGTLNDVEGATLSIPGLWSIAFGNGGRGGDAATLYFTAGIPGPLGEKTESHGLFGSIQPPPEFQQASVVNAAASTAALAPNTFVSILGGALSAITRNAGSSDFVANKLPTTLSGVSVTANGESAFVTYVSPTQINVLLPADLQPGAVKIQTFNNGLESQTATVTLQAAGPAFFVLTGNKYVATHSDGTLVAPAGLTTGVTSSPAKAGETIVIYGNGFGATTGTIPNGSVITTPLPLASNPTFTIGGVNATVAFAGLTLAGVYQLNVVVPAGLPSGDNAIVAQLAGGGASTQANVFISVQ